jgi:hypothetical protein
MAWFVALILILFYVLGRYVLHAPEIDQLPLLALLVIVIDFVGARFSRRPKV